MDLNGDIKMTELEQKVYNALQEVYEERISMTELATSLGMTKNALCKKLAILEKKGVVSRQQPKLKDRYKLKGV